VERSTDDEGRTERAVQIRWQRPAEQSRHNGASGASCNRRQQRPVMAELCGGRGARYWAPISRHRSSRLRVARRAPDVLTGRLHRLERAPIVTAVPYSRRPLRMNYAIIETRRELQGALAPCLRGAPNKERRQQRDGP
jgi:hypothetical protein